VALPEGELVVNSSQGGGSKDTWVVGQDPLQTSRHNIQGLVADQAAVTSSISIIAGDHVQDHSPLESPRNDQEQQQQQAHQPPREGRQSVVPAVDLEPIDAPHRDGGRKKC
jgi:hypothetical protein